jgi:hypothetical protein
MMLTARGVMRTGRAAMRKERVAMTNGCTEMRMDVRDEKRVCRDERVGAPRLAELYDSRGGEGDTLRDEKPAPMRKV